MTALVLDGADHKGLPSRPGGVALKAVLQVVLLSPVVQTGMNLSRLPALMKGVGEDIVQLPFHDNFSTGHGSGSCCVTA